MPLGVIPASTHLLQEGGEHGIGPFFRHWGGEVIYNSHEHDADTSSAIGSIGTPCIIEAGVPTASFQRHEALAFNIVRRLLVSQDHCTLESTNHADNIVHPLPPANIRRVIPFPAPDFIALTGYSDWQSPINPTTR